MAAENNNSGKALFLAGLKPEQEIRLVGANPPLVSLQEILQAVTTAPEMISVQLGRIQVMVQGKVMRLVKLLEADVVMAAKLHENDEHDETVFENVVLEDEDEITLHGNNRHIKSLGHVLGILTTDSHPETASVFLNDLEVQVREKVMKFAAFLRIEREAAIQKIDIKTDLYTFVLLELRNSVNLLPDQVLSMLKGAGEKKLDEALITIAQRISEYISLHFPISTPQLEEHAREIRKIAKAQFEQVSELLAEYLANMIGSVTDLGDRSRGRSLDKSLLGKIHDHPTNRGTIMEKILGKKE